MKILLISNSKYIYKIFLFILKLNLNFIGVITSLKILHNKFNIKINKNILFIKLRQNIFLNSKYINMDFIIEIIKLYNLNIGLIFDFGIILHSLYFQFKQPIFLNIHASLLPKYKGASPILTYLLSGHKYSGISLFKITSVIDCGNLLDQIVIKSNFIENYFSFQKKIYFIIIYAIIRLLKNFSFYKNRFFLQLDIQSSYTKKLSKKDGLLNLNKSAYILECQVRSLCHWPNSFLFINKKKFILKSLIIYERNNFNIFVKKHLFFITKCGILDILKLNFNNKIISNIDYLNQLKNIEV